jgi:deoxyribodipyrimidine photo-lyase
MTDVAIALFTRDLRVHDNPVLRAAARRERIVPMFVLDDGCRGFLAPNRAAFLVDCLDDLRDQLRSRGADLVVRQGDVVDEVSRLAHEVGAAQVHIASDVSRYANRREHALRRALEGERRELVVHDGSTTAVPPGEILPNDRDHFAVFTPYYRRWLEQPLRQPEAAPRRLSMPRVRVGSVPRASSLDPGEASPHLPPGGETAGRRRLDAWVSRVDRYADDHDMLALDATSRLSPYLHFGCLSPVQVIQRVAGSSAGSAAFVRQLAWRDFHHQVLAARPAASSQDYRDRQDQWRHDPEALEAWRTGHTGYPIVDAGMRQLRTEGWMHNRARLIVGSFLTKTLYVDWRLGAAHFRELLVDADIANNQLNWQWVAGTGTDTRPYRVLNPIAQAHRYDPAGEYVRRHVPELAELEAPEVHEPWRLDPRRRSALDYPEPIVDLAAGRQRFLSARQDA